MHTDFIQTWDDVLDGQTCAAIIKQFEASGQAQRGAVGAGVNTALKNSWDIGISQTPGWQAVSGRLDAAMADCLVDYVRKHPYTLLAPMTLHMKIPGSDRPVLLTPEHIARMDGRRLLQLVVKVFRPGTINVQKYLADEGGYPYWHCEFYPRQDDPDTLHRVLLWSVYLNDDFDAGETEFFHQQRKIKPKTGRLVIAPASFTHTHRGNRPRGGDKYIATSWVLFQPAARLYAEGPTA